MEYALVQHSSQPQAVTPRGGVSTPRRLGLSGDAIRVPVLSMADISGVLHVKSCMSEGYTLGRRARMLV